MKILAVIAAALVMVCGRAQEQGGAKGAITINNNITVITNSSFTNLVFTNITDMVNRAPTTHGSTFTLLGRNGLDPLTAGTFLYDSTSSAATNLGTIFKPSGTTGRFLRQYAGPLNILWFGATTNWGDNDNQAFTNAVATFGSNGGQIDFPVGAYGLSPHITNNYLTLNYLGSRDVNIETNTGLFPADITDYIVTLGNDDSYVVGFKMIGFPMHAKINGSNCPGAIHLYGGAFQPEFQHIGAIDGANTVYMNAGSNYPCTLPYFNMCEFWEGTNTTIRGEDIRTGPGYFTGAIFNQTHVNGNNTTGQAISTTTGRLNIQGLYLDGRDGGSLYVTNGGKITGINADLENTSGETAVLLIVDFRGQTYVGRHPARFVSGNVRMQGKVMWIDDTGTNYTQLPTGGGVEWLLDRAGIREPWVSVPLKFGTEVNPFDGVFQMDMAGTNGPFWFKRADGGTIRWVDKTAEMVQDVDGGNVDSYREFEFKGLTTASANVRFFRDTSTSGNRFVQIFRGNGSSESQTLFNAYGDSYLNYLTGNVGIGTNSPSAKLHVAGTTKLGIDNLFEVTNSDIDVHAPVSFDPDGAWDLGSSGFHRPRRIYLSDGATISQGDVWTLINARLLPTRAINTTSPLQGGGTLASDLTLSIQVANAIQNGYLSAGDWTAFNNKVAATRAINTSGSVTGGGNLTADRTLSLVNDNATPGANYHYGTDGAGNKAWIADSAAGEVNVGANVGAGTIGVYNGKSGTTLNFNTLAAGANIAITSNNNVITITGSTGGGGSLSVQEQDGSPNVSSVTTIQVPNGSLTDNGGGNVTMSYVPSSRQVGATGSITGGGDLSANRTHQLVNDSTSPGNSKYYGTGPTGVKGFFTIPGADVDELTASGTATTTDGVTSKDFDFSGSTTIAVGAWAYFEVTVLGGWNSGVSYAAYSWKKRGMIRDMGPGFAGVVNVESSPLEFIDGLTPASVGISSVSATQGTIKVSIIGQAGRTATWRCLVKYWAL